MYIQRVYFFFFHISGRRKSVAPVELNKGNKRLSCVIKPPDMQTKKGKVKDFFNHYSFFNVNCFKHEQNYSSFCYSTFCLLVLIVSGRFPAQPEVLWDDSGFQSNFGNHTLLNYWNGRFEHGLTMLHPESFIVALETVVHSFLCTSLAFFKIEPQRICVCVRKRPLNKQGRSGIICTFSILSSEYKGVIKGEKTVAMFIHWLRYSCVL